MTKDVSANDLSEQARRYIALWFPFLSTDRFRRMSPSAVPDDVPLLLFESRHNALLVVAVDACALRQGLMPGLTLADARARVPALAAVATDPIADAELLLRLAEFCDRFTPSVALDGPQGLVLDVTGCAHLFGGETVLRAEICARLKRFSLSVCAALAGTPDAARALARFAGPSITSPGQDTDDAVDALPVAALGIEAETVHALHRAGLTTIGDLAARPATILAARFGEALIRQLDRTRGREDVRITPLRSPPACRAARLFAEPLTHRDGLEGALAQLIKEVSRDLERRGGGGRSFEASFFRSDGNVRRVAVETGRPTRDPRTIRLLFAERFAALADPIDPGFGFDALRLSVPAIEPLGTPQLALGGRVQDETDVVDLVDRLTARFGRTRIVRFAARDTHNPEREAKGVPGSDAERFAVSWRRPEPGAPPVRPIQLFDPPQPIETLAEVPDGPPLRFRWRRVLHEVALAEGPERISPEWWRASAWPLARDYYRIEDGEGRRFWVFREGLYGTSEQPPRWFLHGLFA